MYIRTREQALDAVAEILNIPVRQSQIVQSTVKIMLCLDADQREFMGDCQSLLLEGGLEALRMRRTHVLDGQDIVPLIVVDPEEDRLYEEVAASLDALRLSDVVRHVFDSLHADRWQVARAMRAKESDLKYQVVAAIKFRHRANVYRTARLTVEQLIEKQRPVWYDRAGTLRAICLDAVKRAELDEPSLIHEEADFLFQVIALTDSRAIALLGAFDLDREQAIRDVERIREAITLIREAQAEEKQKVRQVA